MINLFLNVSDSGELERCLDILEKRGLLDNSNNGIVPVVKQSATVAPSTDGKAGRGSFMQRLSIKSQARLAELGLTEVPKATAEELALRKIINEKRATNNEKGILWPVDLVAREEALALEGYDIYNVPADQSPAEPAEDFVIDYGNPLA